VLLRELARTKHGAVARPRSAVASARRSRHIPAGVKRAVWQRDGGRCAFMGAQGRCVETGFLEFHHFVPYSAGGEATIANIALRCRAHNAHEAEQDFALC
jgi:5-methylcytosine-specific restriction endonuclease McrA